MTIKGLGTDIVEVARVAKAIERWGNHFLEHVFHEEEIAYCLRFKFPQEHFAGRFAAKEAVIKALENTDSLQWTDIKIKNQKNGKPFCQINSKSFQGKILISISHTKIYATAVAIIEK